MINSGFQTTQDMLQNIINDFRTEVKGDINGLKNDVSELKDDVNHIKNEIVDIRIDRDYTASKFEVDNLKRRMNKVEKHLKIK
ncbi:MAG TPA: hypothetical protein VEC17_03005 [Candidatus Binatia bacterium]|nr:hypothetical protein [Candidatus Binatia bacterium]